MLKSKEKEEFAALIGEKVPGVPTYTGPTWVLTYEECLELITFLPKKSTKGYIKFIVHEFARIRAGDQSLHAEIDRQATSNGLEANLARSSLGLPMGTQISADEMAYKQKLWGLEIQAAEENKRTAEVNRIAAENKRKITEVELRNATQESTLKCKKLQDIESDLQHTTGAQLKICNIAGIVFGVKDNSEINMWIGREAAQKFRARYKRNPPRNPDGVSQAAYYTETHRELLLDAAKRCKAIFDVSGIPK